MLAAERSQLGESERLLIEALRLDPKNHEAKSDLAYNLYLQERFAESEGLLQEVLRVEPRNERASNNLGLVLGMMGRRDESLRSFQQASDDAEAYANLAFVLTQRGELKEAEANYHRALARDNSLRPAAEGLIQVHRLNRRVEASIAQSQSAEANRDPQPAMPPQIAAMQDARPQARRSNGQAASTKPVSATVAHSTQPHSARASVMSSVQTRPLAQQVVPVRAASQPSTRAPNSPPAAGTARLAQDVSPRRASQPTPLAKPVAMQHTSQPQRLAQDVSPRRASQPTPLAKPVAMQHTSQPQRLAQDVSPRRASQPTPLAKPVAMQHTSQPQRLAQDVSPRRTSRTIQRPSAPHGKAAAAAQSNSFGVEPAVALEPAAKPPWDRGKLTRVQFVEPAPGAATPHIPIPVLPSATFSSAMPQGAAPTKPMSHSHRGSLGLAEPGQWPTQTAGPPAIHSAPLAATTNTPRQQQAPVKVSVHDAFPMRTPTWTSQSAAAGAGNSHANLFAAPPVAGGGRPRY